MLYKLSHAHPLCTSAPAYSVPTDWEKEWRWQTRKQRYKAVSVTILSKKEQLDVNFHLSQKKVNNVIITFYVI